MNFVLTWIQRQDRQDLTFMVGCLLLFLGLSISVSVATALSVVGAVLAVESVLTSYVAAWISTRKA